MHSDVGASRIARAGGRVHSPDIWVCVFVQAQALQLDNAPRTKNASHEIVGRQLAEVVKGVVRSCRCRQRKDTIEAGRESDQTLGGGVFDKW